MTLALALSAKGVSRSPFSLTHVHLRLAGSDTGCMHRRLSVGLSINPSPSLSVSIFPLVFPFFSLAVMPAIVRQHLLPVQLVGFLPYLPNDIIQQQFPSISHLTASFRPRVSLDAGFHYTSIGLWLPPPPPSAAPP